MKYSTATPYIAAFVIMRQDNKVAFVLREHTAWMNGYYGLVSGKVEKNESFLQAAIRETKEEAGVTIKPVNLKYVHTMHRKSDDNTWVDVFFEANKWEGEAYNAQDDEHSELAWLDLDNLPKNIIPPVRAALQFIKEGKIYSEYAWEQ